MSLCNGQLLKGICEEQNSGPAGLGREGREEKLGEGNLSVEDAE